MWKRHSFNLNISKLDWAAFKFNNREIYGVENPK